MLEQKIGEVVYQIGDLRPKQARNILRRLFPLIAAAEASIKEMAAELRKGLEEVADGDTVPGSMASFGRIGEALQKLPDDDLDYVFDNCFAVVLRRTDTGWRPIFTPGGGLQYQDINLATQFALVFYVLKENFMDFYNALLGLFSASPATDQK